ncbi:MAG: NADH-quinone oxidoreductase subunit L, partial [Gemmatimonadetes bacterium]|nr:NADH-quinone oxidoreductase subunit L [Gemmatimonadota bacterium]NIS00866.1 NADH-quinone oxidoreductase subunit L [Gemmatimonadota bacterium]NIT66688.1 NADH-quinone oxidoreductase subunit L [Gemmatimonadota bacterium]NIU53736.1 NADH-quinone oxidoreductase subunit L [Gemmatimonadota bacterium]NIV23468.1 NADH-quinone oxidoreductase subunit L [Gemmatimonadota bacterium]
MGDTVLWGLAIVTAVLTAAYIARWMWMVFYGENRTPGGAGDHMHAASGVMAIPLVILAVGSVLSGWINIPAALPALPEFTWLHEFLH